MTKLNFNELENVSGEAATQTYEYQIIELATNAVAGSYTDSTRKLRQRLYLENNCYLRKSTRHSLSIALHDTKEDKPFQDISRRLEGLSLESSNPPSS